MMATGQLRRLHHDLELACERAVLGSAAALSLIEEYREPVAGGGPPPQGAGWMICSDVA